MPTGGSISGSQSSANRRYTDTPTTIIGGNSLDIYVEGTTYLLGAVLDVTADVAEEDRRSVLSATEGEEVTTARGLTLNTGDFIFDDFHDVDEAESASGGISVGVNSQGATTLGTTPFGYSYRNREAITHATVGEGLIRVRNVADGEVFDFRALNRNVDNVQQLIRDESFEINLPAIDLTFVIESIKEAVEEFKAYREELARQRGEEETSGRENISIDHDDLWKKSLEKQYGIILDGEDFLKVFEPWAGVDLIGRGAAGGGVSRGAREIYRSVFRGDVPATSLKGFFSGGNKPKASELKNWAERNGWTATQTTNGPLVYKDANGIKRIEIKRGSARTAGSENPHVSVRNKSGRIIDPLTGKPTAKRSPGNHREIDFDF